MRVQISEPKEEQIYDKEEFINTLFNRIKKYVEKDEFDLLQIKSKRKLENGIEVLDKKTEKLMKQNSEAKQHKDKFQEKLDGLKQNNEDQIQQLKELI